MNCLVEDVIIVMADTSTSLDLKIDKAVKKLIEELVEDREMDGKDKLEDVETICKKLFENGSYVFCDYKGTEIYIMPAEIFEG